MFYTIYKITNNIDGKYYIGKHKTKDLNDGYMGSGKLIKRAIKKYGVESFSKQILFVFDNEAEMNEKEKELVIVSEQTYNLCEGGHGGFSYINSSPEIISRRDTRRGYWNNLAAMTDPIKNKKGGNNSKLYKSGINDPKKRCNWTGRKHKPETIQKLKKSKNSGSSNQNYGKMWITNGISNKSIPKEHLDLWVERGYRKGRIMKPL